MKRKQQATNGAFAGTTHIMFVLDKSGSMGSVRDATISGFNEWLHTLQMDSGDLSLTLTLFDTEVRTPIQNEPLANVNDLDYGRYEPDGLTALYDAIAGAVRATEPKVKDGDRALVVIMTDGQENSSREMTRQKVFDLIRDHEARGNWTFTYLSCHPDAYADAQSVGMSAGNVAHYVGTVAGTTQAMRRMADATSSHTHSVASSRSDFYSGTGADPLSTGNTGRGSHDHAGAGGHTHDPWP